MTQLMPICRGLPDTCAQRGEKRTRIYAFLFTFISQFGIKRGAVAEGLVQQSVYANPPPKAKHKANTGGGQECVRWQ